MTEKRPRVTVRIPESILRKVDAEIESGKYSDRTDCIIQALLYQLNREEIRRELSNEVISQVAKDRERWIYSDETMQFIGELIHSTMTKIFEDRDKHRKR